MLYGNRDIYALQHIVGELDTVLALLKPHEKITLLKELQSHLQVGGVTVPIQFDRLLYPSESDILVMFMQGGFVTDELLRQKLGELGYKKEQIMNTSLSSQKETYVNDSTPLKEIWFARDSGVIEEAFVDSQRKDIRQNCFYYKDIPGELQFFDTSQNHSLIDGRTFQGALVLPDKVILPVHQGYAAEPEESEIIDILKNYRYAYAEITDTVFQKNQAYYQKVLKKHFSR